MEGYHLAFIDYFKWGKRPSPETANLPLTPGLLTAWGGGYSLTKVGDETALSALQLSVVASAVKLISSSFGIIELAFYGKDSEGNREKIDDDPRSEMVRYSFNEWQSPSAFWSYLIPSRVLKGNAFARIERNGGGVPAYLVPLNADAITVKRIGGRKVYVYAPDPSTAPEVIEDADMIHVYGESLDGLTGISPLYLGTRAIALAKEAEDFAYRFYKNGSNQRLFVKYPTSAPKPEDRTRIKSEVKDELSGEHTQHSIGVLYGGAEIVAVGGPNAHESQLIETRQNQALEVLALLGVPAHALGLPTSQSFRSREEADQDFIKKCLLPIAREIEREFNRKLVKREEWGSKYFEFSFESLLRSDLAGRYTAYSTGIMGGWLNVDTVCEKENLPKPPNGQGQNYLVPANMNVAGSPEPVATTESGPTPVPGSIQAKQNGALGGAPEGNTNAI